MSNTVWDYVVVGGGIAGSVVAARLLQLNPLLRILLVEAGPDASENEGILYADSANLDGGTYDWKYQTVPQKNLGNRRIDLPCGKALGGGSVINYGAWIRGHRVDFDLWGKTVNDSRWTYEGLLPYMKMAENVASATVDSHEHGTDGPVHLQTSVSTSRAYPLRQAVLESWEEVGIQKLPFLDANAGIPLGVGDFYENRRQGRRQIAPVSFPLNGIAIMPNTIVAKILFKKKSAYSQGHAQACGIQLADGTEIHGKEVILSLGAIRTPQLLMLSGIGPANELAKHGIEVMLDAPHVGDNLSDHGRIGTMWKLNPSWSGSALGPGNEIFQQPQYRWGLPLDFVVTTGIQNKAGLAEAIEADEGVAPDPATHPLLNQDRAFNEHLIMYTDGGNGSAITFVLVNLLPTSRGKLTMSTSDINDPPLIDPNYNSTEVDKFVMREGLRLQIKLAGSKFATMGRDILGGELGIPGFEGTLTSASTDEYLNSRVAAGLISSYHPMGTAAMGKVVDADLKVNGVSGLRVVDASVFPSAITGHPQVALYAMALQAAEIIHNQELKSAN